MQEFAALARMSLSKIERADPKFPKRRRLGTLDSAGIPHAENKSPVTVLVAGLKSSHHTAS
jgi:hypothetical protein